MNRNSLLVIRLLVIGCWLLVVSQLGVFASSTTEGFRLKRMEGERVRWRVWANVGHFKENLKTLEGIKLRFYPKERGPFTIKAVEGWVRENNNKDEIFLKNNVRLKGYLKDTDIKCESLFWDSSSELMQTPDRVEIKGEKWHISGKGMKLSPDGDVIILKKNVTMKIQSYEKF